MKNFIKVLRFIAPLLAMSTAFYSQTFAQKFDMPDGEEVGIIKTFTGSTDYRMVATKTTVYCSKYEGRTWNKSKKLYEAKPTRYIADATFKVGEAGDIRSLAILLDNGEVLILSYDGTSETVNPSPVLYDPPLQPPINYSFDKILYTNVIIVRSFSYAYSNKLDGNGWKLDSAGLGKTTITDITLDRYQTLFAASNKGIWKYDHRNERWIQTGGSINTQAISTIFGSRDGRVFAFIKKNGLWSSSDWGATWIRENVSAGDTTIAKFSDDIENNVYAVGVTADPRTGIADYHLYRKKSTNTSWDIITPALLSFSGIQPAPGVLQFRFNCLAGETTLEIGTNFGCYSGANNGESWIYTSNGISAEKVASGQFLGNALIVSTAAGIFRKVDTTWTRVFPKTGMISTVELIKSDKANLCYFKLPSNIELQSNTSKKQGAIFVSSDDGYTWQADTLGLSIVPTGITSLFTADREGKKSIIVNSLSTDMPLLVYTANPLWKIDTLGIGKIYPLYLNQININTTHIDYSMANQYIGGSIYVNNTKSSLFYKRQYPSGHWYLDTIGLNKSVINSITSGKKYTYCSSFTLNGSSSLFVKSNFPDWGWEMIPSPPYPISNVRTMCVDSSGILYVGYSKALNTFPTRGVYATDDNGTTWQYAGLDSIEVYRVIATNEAAYALSERGMYKLTLQPLKAPTAKFSNKEINFGKVPIGAYKDTVIRVVNSGNQTLNVTDFSSADKAVTAFSVIPSHFVLDPGRFIDVKIRFVPSIRGIHTTTLLTFGNTIPETILVSGEGTRKPDTAFTINLKSREIIFDAIRIGEYKDTLLEIGNTGKQNIYVTEISSTNPAFFCLRSSFMVFAGGKTYITIRYSPSRIGYANGYLRFVSTNGSDSIQVTGNCIETTSIQEENLSEKSKILVSPNPSSGNAVINVSMQNTGTISLVVSNILGEDTCTIFNGTLEKGNYCFPISIHVNGGYFVRMITKKGVETLHIANVD